MGKKHKKSSTSTDDNVKAKKHKKYSITTDDVETAHVSSSTSLKNGKIVLKPCSEGKENLKKQKIHKEKSEQNDEDEIVVFIKVKEFKEMKKSIKELSKAMKKLQEILLSKTNLLEVSLKKKEEETPKKKEEPESMCCFDGEEVNGNNSETICVKGFETLRHRDEIKKDLSDIFGSCGEVTRVFVPIECKIRLPLGFAFINLKNGEGNDKALALSGTYMGGRELEVMMADESGHYNGFTNFAGCDRCHGPPLCCREHVARPHGKVGRPRAKIPDFLLNWFRANC